MNPCLFRLFLPLFAIFSFIHPAHAQWVFEGAEGPGNGKHIVLVAGDEEYRSEESCPMLGKILAKHHGFKATVLFPIHPSGGYIDPNHQKNIPGMDAIATADVVIIGTRFRDLPDEQLKAFADYLNAGKPVIGFRTATHGFRTANQTGGIKWGQWGVDVLGEGWAGHYGRHKHQGARGVLNKEHAGHPILKGVGTFFGESDVYGVRRVTEDNATVLAHGVVTDSLYADAKITEGKTPQVSVWIREYKTPKGTPGKALASTFGASSDFADEHLRRLFVNAVYHLTGLPVPAKANVSYVDPFQPSAYGFHKDKSHFETLNLRPADFDWGKNRQSGPKLSTLLADGPQRRTAEAKGTSAGAADKAAKKAAALPLAKGDHIAFVGDGLGSRALQFGHIETELYLRHPDKELVFRNLCDEGNTPGFRPHPGRNDPWAFPGAERFQTEFATPSKSGGHFEHPDTWLTRVEADTLVCFFGFSSSFEGPDRLPNFKAELAAFFEHTLAQQYNGQSAPRLALVSPIAFEARPDLDIPAPDQHNHILAAYTKGMRDVAEAHGVRFVDAFSASKQWYAEADGPLTIDGALLSSAGYKKLAALIADEVFAEADAPADPGKHKAVYAAVTEKNWIWQNHYKIPNGVHAYGRRYNPYGPGNYPFELEKLEQMGAKRDQAIHAALSGTAFDLKAADAATRELPPVPSSYRPSAKTGSPEYKSGEDALKDIRLAEGYKMELFASEQEFPDLANPVQMSFDNQGRLWIATMPSYPHYRPGDARPDDKIIILEDTDGDHRADKQTTFARGLHLPMGFELAPEGVYVSQGFSLVLLQDTHGDDQADEYHTLLSGFDDHDTHHAISAFCADPSGAIYLSEGLFLHSNVDTVYGTIRGTNGGFFRYNPHRRHLERFAQLSIPNPWGIAVDRWGQEFFLNTSSTKVNWMMPGSVLPRYGERGPRLPDLIERKARVRPTSGIEFVRSRHFPDEVQGDMLINNNIGFLGTKQHKVEEDGTGYKTSFRQDLVSSSYGNYRPVDLEFAPDGSLYIVDWHNVLIGHMQHSARDPLRDHSHGRIYRVSYPARPLVKPAHIAGAPIATLLDNLTLPEDRSRYRTRRELRGRKASDVLPALRDWLAVLDPDDPDFAHHRLEALWVSWGLNRIDVGLLKSCLEADDHRVRSAAVRALRFNPQIEDQADWLMEAARDPHGRVRMEAIAAASRLPRDLGLPIIQAAGTYPTDMWTQQPYAKALAHISGHGVEEDEDEVEPPKHVKGKEAEKLYIKGHQIYNEAENCVLCHAPKGEGLAASGFPPLAKTQWVNGPAERIIRLTVKGIAGPIEVNGTTYNNAMAPFEGRLDDKELAAVLTYVRNAFGNRASVITPDEVRRVRAKIKDVPFMGQAADLLKEYPHEEPGTPRK